jgi:[ribosomal protein S5]-alanine N-acetyltransferase
MEFTTERLLIREVVLDDLANIHLLDSMPDIDEFNTMGIPETIQITENIVKEWIAQQASVPRVSYIFCIVNTNINAWIGQIALNVGTPKFKDAEVWYKILPSYWRQGFATEALRRILKFGFEELNLHRIEAGVAVENARSIRTLEKVGMIKEGRKRLALPIRGEWVDNYSYSMLDSDFF